MGKSKLLLEYLIGEYFASQNSDNSCTTFIENSLFIAWEPML